MYKNNASLLLLLNKKNKHTLFLLKHTEQLTLSYLKVTNKVNLHFLMLGIWIVPILLVPISVVINVKMCRFICNHIIHDSVPTSILQMISPK